MRIVLCLPDKMLACAEADLQPDLAHRRCKDQRQLACGELPGHLDLLNFQVLCQKPRLPRRELPAFAAAVGAKPSLSIACSAVRRIEGGAFARATQ